MPRTVVVRVARRPAFAVCGALFLFWFGLACRLYLCLSLCRVRYSLLFFCVVSCSDFFCPNQQPMMSIDHFFGFALQAKKKKKRKKQFGQRRASCVACIAGACSDHEPSRPIHPSMHPSITLVPFSTNHTLFPSTRPVPPLPTSLSPPPLSFHLPSLSISPPTTLSPTSPPHLFSPPP